MTSHLKTPGGRTAARRVLLSATMAGLLLAQHGLGAADIARRASRDRAGADQVRVDEQNGVYRVSARFVVNEPAAVALAVLTDYEQIPRFMPQVRTSVVRERAAGRAVVEQEAVARTLIFSRRIHLVLEVREDGDGVSFRDRCKQSFEKYEGAWRVTEQAGQTVVVYELRAKPSFAVPKFLLNRLLARDAAQMIERLQDEITTRAAAAAQRDRGSS